MQGFGFENMQPFLYLMCPITGSNFFFGMSWKRKLSKKTPAGGGVGTLTLNRFCVCVGSQTRDVV